jgi:hypothetical protein
MRIGLLVMIPSLSINMIDIFSVIYQDFSESDMGRKSETKVLSIT